MKKLKKYGMPMGYKIGAKKTQLLGLSIGLFVFSSLEFSVDSM